jgi:hypothetical protein
MEGKESRQHRVKSDALFLERGENASRLSCKLKPAAAYFIRILHCPLCAARLTTSALDHLLFRRVWSDILSTA